MSMPRAQAVRKRLLGGLIAVMLGATTVGARADDSALERAKEYFRAGAQAYAVGEYAAAVQAFEQANALAPRPAVLFSIAQAERRLYFLERDRDQLRRAIQRYREYLKEEPQGSRKVDAVQALSELEPLAAAMLRDGSAPGSDPNAAAAGPSAGAPTAPWRTAGAGAAGAGMAGPGTANGGVAGGATNASGPGASGAGLGAAGPSGAGAGTSVTSVGGNGVQAAPRSPESSTRVMVSSPALEARIALDGRPAVASPLISEVAAGRHVARIEAPGFFEAVREVVAIKGALVTLDVGLLERPARLVVVAPEGALLSIDGRVQGECPFPKPLELAPGPHLVTVTKNGYIGLSREQVLPRGEEVVMRIPMARSPQRTAAVIMFGAGLSAFAGGGVFAYFSLERDSAARSFLEQVGKSELTTENLADYRAAREGRNNLRTAAWLSVGAGALFVAGGGLLFLLDRRNAEPPPPPAASGTAQQSGKRDVRRDALSLYPTPFIGPGIAGLGIGGEF